MIVIPCHWVKFEPVKPDDVIAETVWNKVSINSPKMSVWLLKEINPINIIAKPRSVIPEYHLKVSFLSNAFLFPTAKLKSSAKFMPDKNIKIVIIIFM